MAPATRADDGTEVFAFLGPEGTFAEQALLSLPEAATTVRVAARSVAEALDAVRDGSADAALVPLENSVGGQVGVTLDELASGPPLVIVREVVLPIQFSLGARPDVSLAEVRRVAAHPQAAAQCRRWLARAVPDAIVVDALSNAGAAVAVGRGEADAALCAPTGLGRYHLVELAARVADHPDALTRFVLVARPGPPPAPTGDDVTTLAVSLAHDRVGALMSVLSEFAGRGINLTRIESRPSGEGLGRYTFFLDCDGHVAQARIGEAVQGLRRICVGVRFLGSYARVRQPNETHPLVSEEDFIEAARWLAGVRAGRAV